MSKEVVIEVRHMMKAFGSTVALDDVSVDIRNGEILGLIGENGSGKSTLTSIIAGMQKYDSASMSFKGKSWAPSSMIEALEKGIGMIVQESGTVPGITVCENIFLGEISNFKNKTGLIDKKKMLSSARAVLENIGADHIDPMAMTGALDFQDRKLIEIAKVMSKNPEVLVVDETTTALSQKGRDIIYRIIHKMKEENKAVVFISHDLDEIMKVCDALTVLRDGKIIVTFEKEEFDEELIKTSMIGRELKGDYYRSDYAGSYSDEVVLEVTDGNLKDQMIDFNLQVHKGEILGIGGLSHCGMHTLGKVLFGAAHMKSGEVRCHGKRVKDEADAMKRKIGYVSKDRDIESLYLNASIKDNIAVGGLDSFAVKNFLILPGKEKKYVQKQIDALSIKCGSMDYYVATLSGGNKQKVVFGKWIGRGSEILVLDCPTRGVDILYRRSIAKDVFGTDDPAKVQELLATWDKFDEAAEALNAKGYMMFSAYTDSYWPFNANKSQPWVDENLTIQLDAHVMEWVDQTKEYTDKGYNNKKVEISDITKDFVKEAKVFGAFAAPWYMDYVTFSCLDNQDEPMELGNGSYGDWAACTGPEKYYWGGTWLCVPQGCDNVSEVKELIYALTCDKIAMKQLTMENGEFVNNKEVMNEVAADTSYECAFLGGQNHISFLADAADSIDMSNTTMYDQGVGDACKSAFRDYFDGFTSKEEATKQFYEFAITTYPELKAPEN